MLIKIIIKCNFLVILLSLFLLTASNLKAEGNEFSFGVGFEPQAITYITEMAPVRIGSIIRLSPANVPVQFLLNAAPAADGVTQITPAGYYTLEEGTSNYGIYLIKGDANTIITITFPSNLDPVPPEITTWNWFGSNGNFTLDTFGYYYNRVGARIILPANSTASGTFTRRFTLEATGG